ncbi:MAG: permease, partial [Verrucomicrobiota bacterium]|nr:permease [Verrucomicrobiota bacterium]
MMRDLRFASRMLVKSPAFSIISILAIALGIGGSTTMFSAINALLLRPLPLIQDQDRLLAVAQYFFKKPDLDAGTAFPDYLEFKTQATTLEGFAAAEMNTMILSGGDKPERYLGAGISADCFT